MVRKILPALILILFLSACGLFADNETDVDVEPTTTPPAATPAPTPLPVSSPPVVEPDDPVSTGITLTVWTTLDISPRLEAPGGFALAEQLAAFEHNHPHVTLEIQQKTVTGQGGILSYLRTGRQVAPTILPDLVVLPTDQLAVATNEKLIFPIAPYVNEEMLDDLYPAVYTQSRVDNNLMAYPFAVTNVQHFIYNRDVITGTLPATWNGLIELEEASLVFPVAGGDGAELALQFYLALGGTLTNEANQPHLDVDVLQPVLNYFSRARSSGLIAPQSNNVATLPEAWQIFQGGGANVAHTKVNHFLAERALGFDSGYGPIPGPNAPLSPLVRSWSWAISTPDPTRQALAAELMTWLTSSPNLGSWSAQSNLLPARRTAFDYWPDDEPYKEFVQEQLERAQPFPAAAGGTILTAISNAVFDVVSLSTSSQAAAEQAASEVRP